MAESEADRLTARKDSHRCSSDCGPECLPCEDAKALARELSASKAQCDALTAEREALKKTIARLSEKAEAWNEIGARIENAAIGYNAPQIVSVFTDNQQLRHRVVQAEARANVAEREVERLNGVIANVLL